MGIEKYRMGKLLKTLKNNIQNSFFSYFPRSHTDKPVMTCYICDEGYIGGKLPPQGIKIWNFFFRSHTEKPVICYTCGEGFDDQQQAVEHRIAEHDSKAKYVHPPPSDTFRQSILIFLVHRNLLKICRITSISTVVHHLTPSNFVRRYAG